MNKFEIAGLRIDMDCPDWFIHSSLKSFTSNHSQADITFRTQFAPPPPVPAGLRRLTLKRYATSYIDGAGTIYISYNDPRDIPNHVIIRNNWTDNLLYIDPAFNLKDIGNIEHVQNNIMFALREYFLPALIARGGVLVHSASIEFKGHAILFSAPSGTGKTTHVGLWKKKYDISVLDGDIAACRMLDGNPTAYGLPWCGSSGEFMNKRLPLQAIVFLEQSPVNEITKLPVSEAVIRLYARSFLYVGDENMTIQVLSVLQQLVENADCYLLKCRPDFEAVELVKQCL